MKHVLASSSSEAADAAAVVAAISDQCAAVRDVLLRRAHTQAGLGAVSEGPLPGAAGSG